MALLHCTWFYITLPWLYFTLLHSILLYNGSTSPYFNLHYSIYHGFTWLHLTILDTTVALHSILFTLHYSTVALLHSTLHFSTMALLHATWHYITLPWLYFTVHYSTLLYHGSISLYFTLLHFTLVYHGSTQHYTTMDLHHSPFLYINSTWLYITLPWLYFILLDSTVLYHRST